MNELIRTLGLLADPSRLRILLVLGRKELCVCQIMGVLEMPQPLVSRNLALLSRGGLLDARRDGKMMYYRRKKTLPEPQASLVKLLTRSLGGDETRKKDLESLADCAEFQKKTGKCGMETYLKYMEHRKRSRKA